MNSTGAEMSAHPQPRVIILLVEDAPGDILLIKEALQTCPVPVALTVAEDGEKALDPLTEGEVKPIWSSLTSIFPKSPDIWCWSNITHGKASGCKFLVQPGAKLDIDRAMALGAREVVHKPMDVQAFMDAVRGIVRRWGGEGHLAL